MFCIPREGDVVILPDTRVGGDIANANVMNMATILMLTNTMTGSLDDFAPQTQRGHQSLPYYVFAGHSYTHCLNI